MNMEENNTKEINLLQLISMFFKWLQKIGITLLNTIGYLFRLCYRSIYTFLILIALSLIVGQYLARPSARTYKAEAMTMLYGSEAQTVKEICKQLENSLSTNKLISLATKLSLPDSVAKNIVEIKSFYVIDYLNDKTADKIDFGNNHSLTDTLNVRMSDRLFLQLKLKKINQLQQIQTAILNYFNSNRILQNQFNIKKDEHAQQIHICNLELQRVDSLAQVSYFKDNEKQINYEKDKLLVGEQKKQLFYDDLLRLQSIKSYAEMKLVDFVQPVEMPSGFVVNPTPLNGRVKYGVYSLFIGFAIAVIVLLLIENLKYIFSYLRK